MVRRNDSKQDVVSIDEKERRERQWSTILTRNRDAWGEETERLKISEGGKKEGSEWSVVKFSTFDDEERGGKGRKENVPDRE